MLKKLQDENRLIELMMMQEEIKTLPFGYIEENYRDGELSELARELNYDVYGLSKEIKRQTELDTQMQASSTGYFLRNSNLHRGSTEFR